MRIEATPATAANRPAVRAAATAPAPAPTTAGDHLALTNQAQAPVAPAKIVRGPETWIGIASGGGAVALAAWGLIAVAGAPALPILAGAAGLMGVLAICGVGLTSGWGESDTPKPYDKSKPDWSPMAIMTRVAGAIGMVGSMVGTAFGTGAVAMAAGPAAVVAWPAAVIATALVGVLTWAALKEPNPLGRK